MITQALKYDVPALVEIIVHRQEPPIDVGGQRVYISISIWRRWLDFKDLGRVVVYVCKRNNGIKGGTHGTAR